MNTLRIVCAAVLLFAALGSARSEESAIEVVRPEPGTVTTEKTHALGVIELAYANNTRCYVKSLPGASPVICRFTFLGGVSEETEKTRCLTEAAMAALGMGAHATEKHGPEAFKKLFGDPATGIVPNLGLTELHFDVVASPERLEDCLFAARLLVLGARLSPEAFDGLRSQLAGVLVNTMSNVQQQALWARARVASGGDIRMLPPPFERIGSIRREDAQAWLDRMLRTAPLTVSLAGDVAPERAKELLSAYVGSLPARPAPGQEPPGRQRTGPWGKERDSKLTIASSTPAAASVVGWPVADDVPPEEQAALHLGAHVIQRRVAAALGQKLGTAHRPSCWYDRQRYRGADGLWLFTMTSPRKAGEVVTITQAEARKLIAEEAEIAELVDARKAMDMNPATMAAGRWAYELSMLPAAGLSIDAFARHAQLLDSVDSDAVRKALATTCKDERAYTILVSTPLEERGPEKMLKAGEEGDLYVEGSDFPSRVYLPEDYAPGKKLPVILFLHGSGAKPSTDVWRTATDGRGAVVVGLSYGGQADGGAGGRVLGDAASARAGAAYIEKVRAALEKRYGSDPARVVLSGFSMGGWAVNYYGFLAEAKGRYRGFAILGAGTTDGPAVDLALTKGLPVLLLNGADDMNLPVAEKGRPLLEKAGAEVTQVVLDGQGHVPSNTSMREPLSRWLAAVLKD